MNIIIYIKSVNRDMKESLVSGHNFDQFETVPDGYDWGKDHMMTCFSFIWLGSIKD